MVSISLAERKLFERLLEKGEKSKLLFCVWPGIYSPDIVTLLKVETPGLFPCRMSPCVSSELWASWFLEKESDQARRRRP